MFEHEIMTAGELLDKQLPSKPIVVEGMLPTGTYILAGTPKIFCNTALLERGGRSSLSGNANTEVNRAVYDIGGYQRTAASTFGEDVWHGLGRG